MKTCSLLAILTLWIIGCATYERTPSKGGVDLQNEQPDGSVSDDRDYFRNLADYLHQIPGIDISGPENNQIVTIRGISSFHSGIEPLFVINGLPAANSYMQAKNNRRLTQ